MLEKPVSKEKFSSSSFVVGYLSSGTSVLNLSSSISLIETLSTEYKSIAGVYNSSDSHRDWFGGDGGEGKKEPIPDIDLKNIMYSVPGKDGKEEGDTNSNILVIHNNVASEYTYSTTLADNSLTENKFYEISLYVLTYGVDESKTAKISLKLHNSTYERYQM